ncbi:hypothetical protein [Sphingobacterium athyrii]|uniref:Uncharacterized protein n=1 Tax=Sphingobacterium athyrii TaxID=2152717 RepID=A0A363NWG6_9SPHI|nr:hypothetical protein [Sphingobacterium athyrii]PUV25145.1 hypothetical protein DCO56_09405 [Sphingobacterium athyrii]
MMSKIFFIILEKVIVELAKIGILKLLNHIQWKQNFYLLKRLLLKQFDLEKMGLKVNALLKSDRCYSACKKVMFITLQSTYVISGMIFLIAHSLGCNIFFATMIASSLIIAIEIPYRMLLKEAKI